MRLALLMCIAIGCNPAVETVEEPPAAAEADANGLRFIGDSASIDEGAVLLVFWEAWCPHCRTELPDIQENCDNKWRDKVDVVGITRLTRNTPESTARALLTDNDITFPNAIGGHELAKRFDIRGIPASVLLKDGEEVWSGHPKLVTDSVLELAQ